MTERITVMGVGNSLCRDEGVGNAVVEVLERDFVLPENVRVVDAGTMGLTILNLFRDVDYLVVIDAVTGTGEAPGTVVFMTPEEIAPNQVMHSMHDARLVDVLSAAELLGMQPETDFVGVEVEKIEQIVPGLTPVVEAAVPQAIAAVLELLGRRGVSAQRREPA